MELKPVIPEDANISSVGLIKFMDSMDERQINLHSFMLLRHGDVVAEGYYKPFEKDDEHIIYSVTKSFTSAAIGLAIEEGLLSLGDKIIDFFPEKIENNVHPYTAQMTIEHLLTMSTVYAKSTDTNCNDWVKGFINSKPTHRPGTTFAYDTTGTHTLCAILQKLTGMTVHQYMKTRLFDKIGIGQVKWDSCPMGINKGGSGISCKTEDMARFGQFYLQKGNWKGQQILSTAWIEASTTKQIDTSNTRFMLEGKNGYGYKFWLTRNNGYCAFGMGGQFILVLPDKDLVFVTTANTMMYREGHQLILDSFWENIYPYVYDNRIERDEQSYNILQSKLKDLSLILPKGEKYSEVQNEFSNKIIQLEDNPYGFNSVQFNFSKQQCTIHFHKENESAEINFGMRDWIKAKEPFRGFECVAAATWVDAKTLVINVQTYIEVQMFILTCRFEEDFIVIHILPAGGMKTDDVEGYINSKKF